MFIMQEQRGINGNGLLACGDAGAVDPLGEYRVEYKSPMLPMAKHIGMMLSEQHPIQIMPHTHLVDLFLLRSKNHLRLRRSCLNCVDEKSFSDEHLLSE